MNEDRTHGDDSAINDDEALPRPPSSEPISFGYTNYRGEQAARRAIPVRLYWGSTEYHREEQWLFEAYDVEKHAMRDFALRDCNFTGDRVFRERGTVCLNCKRQVEIGQVVMAWDDAGEMHADCANPYRIDVKQPEDSPPLAVLLGNPMGYVPLAGLAHGPVQSKLTTALNRPVTGLGASYNRDTDSWGIYTMPDTVPFATIIGWDGIDWTMEALRKHLWHELQPTMVEKLREAIVNHDARLATCPYHKPKPPSSEQPCKECGGTVSTGCFRGANAAGDVVRAVKRILDGDAA